MPVPRADATRRRPPGSRRAALLELLAEHGRPMTVAEVAPLVGLHPNTVRAHLDVLVRTGRVTRSTEARSTPGRPRELYEAAGAPDEEGSHALLAELLAAGLAEAVPDPAGAAARAGRRWAATSADVTAAPLPGPGDTSAALDPVIRLLTRTGFAPELSEDASTIRLHHCPFRDVAAAHPGVVCSAHLGIIQGALDRLGTDVVATRILPFVQPDLCLAELGRRAQ